MTQKARAHGFASTATAIDAVESARDAFTHTATSPGGAADVVHDRDRAMSATADSSHVATVIQRLAGSRYEIALFCEALPRTLPAYIAELNPASHEVILHTFAQEREIAAYAAGGRVSFDLERRKEHEAHEHLSLEDLPTTVVRGEGGLYELQCTLPRSILLTERRGGIRVPFIQGMHADVRLQLYSNALQLDARLRDLSTGGCFAEIPIDRSASIGVGLEVPRLTITFPSGSQFTAPARIRHLRALGKSRHVGVGLKFQHLVPEQREELTGYVHEAERELAYRIGLQSRTAGLSPLFTPRRERRAVQTARERAVSPAGQLPPTVNGVQELARELQVLLLFIKNHDHFPESMLYDNVDALLYLYRRNRSELLYSLAFIGHEPQWVSHTLRCSVRLLDMLSGDPSSHGALQDVTAGSLLHNMGKPLLVSDQLPSLDRPLSPAQKVLLRSHVERLQQQFKHLDWQPRDPCQDIIAHCNERLDGSGYPQALGGDALSQPVRTLSLIKVLDTLTHARSGNAPRTPLSAYRWLNERTHQYDKEILVRYIRRYGLYPIGSLARFSRGFLAWIVALDERGMPSKVHVVKNLAFQDTNLDSTLDAHDMNQIGSLERIVNPEDYELPHGQGQEALQPEGRPDPT